MDVARLRAELTTDPLTKGYAALSDADAAASLNVPGRAWRVPTDPRALGAALDAHGRLVAVLRAAEDAMLAAAARNSARALIEAARLGLGTVSLEPSPGGTKGPLDHLVDGGVLTASQRDACYALGARTGSRAEELGLGTVHYSEVRQARRD